MTQRYELCYQAQIGDTLRTLPRAKYGYRDFTDNQTYVVSERESLFTIASRFYRGKLKRPSMWYWVIADFQPTPIIDVTRTIEAGTKLIIPSVNTILNQIMSANRIPEFETW